VRVLAAGVSFTDRRPRAGRLNLRGRAHGAGPGGAPLGLVPGDLRALLELLREGKIHPVVAERLRFAGG
jgi:hypothetical protein